MAAERVLLAASHQPARGRSRTCPPTYAVPPLPSPAGAAVLRMVRSYVNRGNGVMPLPTLETAPGATFVEVRSALAARGWAGRAARLRRGRSQPGRQRSHLPPSTPLSLLCRTSS